MQIKCQVKLILKATPDTTTPLSFTEWLEFPKKTTFKKRKILKKHSIKNS